MSALTSTERRAMRAKAHHLEPVVHVGQHGLTPAVQHEIDVALTAHELIKVRVQDESRVDRQAMLASICTALDCAPVQHLGKVLVLWRANPQKHKADARRAAAERAPSAGKARDGKGKPATGAPARDAGSERRRRRNAQGGKAGDTTLPYFSRRGAGRFVADTPDGPAPGAAAPRGGTGKPRARDAGTPRGRAPHAPGHAGPRPPAHGTPRDNAPAPRAPRVPRETAPAPRAPRVPRDAEPAPRAPRDTAPAPRAPGQAAPRGTSPRGRAAAAPRTPAGTSARRRGRG